MKKSILLGCLLVGALFAAAAHGQGNPDQKSIQLEIDRVLATGGKTQVDSSQVRIGNTVRLPGATAVNEAKVEVQLGTVDGKPAFVEIASPASTLKRMNPELNEAVAELSKAGKKTLGSGDVIQFCAGERECVKTCVTAEGVEYCCKWQCQK